MKSIPGDCCILNTGSGAWAFEDLAEQLSAALGVPASTEPREFNYLLNFEPLPAEFPHRLFISLPSIRLAGDKRLLAEAFRSHGVPAPETLLHDTFPDVVRFLIEHPGSEWCLKYPTGCGAAGHRLISADSPEPPNWPRPFVLQEFVRLERPEVYRAFCAGGELFGWIARRFPPDTQPSPWVAHVRGARYESLGEPPREALLVARAALLATGLYETFGCVDLLRRPSGEWLALEVGTDGVFNYVDRHLGIPAFEAELQERVARAFWRQANKPC